MIAAARVPGRGAMWSAETNGCSLTFYGPCGCEDEAHGAALSVAAVVNEEMPEAFVQCLPYESLHGDRQQTPVVGWKVHARVTADDVAAFPNGPTHLRAIANLRTLTKQAQGACRWLR